MESNLKHVLRSLSKQVYRLLGLTPNELRSTKKIHKIVAKVQEIQSKWQPQWPNKGNLTKLLLIIGRVARVVAQFEQQPDPYDSSAFSPIGPRSSLKTSLNSVKPISARPVPKTTSPRSRTQSLSSEANAQIPPKPARSADVSPRLPEVPPRLSPFPNLTQSSEAVLTELPPDAPDTKKKSSSVFGFIRSKLEKITHSKKEEPHTPERPASASTSKLPDGLSASGDSSVPHRSSSSSSAPITTVPARTSAIPVPISSSISDSHLVAGAAREQGTLVVVVFSLRGSHPFSLFYRFSMPNLRAKYSTERLC